MHACTLGTHSAGAAFLTDISWHMAMLAVKSSKSSTCTVALQVRMTQDIPGDGYYYSAVAAFVTRTAYANIRGDQMVGWANSSLRAPRDLPDVSRVKGRGVVLETPLEDALHPSDRAPAGDQAQAAEAGESGDGSGRRMAESGSSSAGPASRGAVLCSPDAAHVLIYRRSPQNMATGG